MAIVGGTSEGRGGYPREGIVVWKSDYLILSHLNTLKCSNAGQELLDLGRKVGLASTYQKLVLLVEILEDETLTYNK